MMPMGTEKTPGTSIQLICAVTASDGIEENFPAEEAGERGGGDADGTGGDIVARENKEDERGRDKRGEEDDPRIKLRIHRGVRISSG